MEEGDDDAEVGEDVASLVDLFLVLGVPDMVKVKGVTVCSVFFFPWWCCERRDVKSRTERSYFFGSAIVPHVGPIFRPKI